ncbi:MAG: UDP-N-acetylmuramoyl-L-alanyl-D-glutamate--2,6-diaminopimelate ligase [Lewinellaceae bacterium]|nr:UDP-N-acetylmuramoyl-L-alanyl-D-glutamate--2,6-diaminopimelate ligase [Saprospiraceae bacterium]MCB9341068.1 UDP-N-acetylmuramoyl-L-alanyl-D-glutamate--2,6-diaminopimelate ligase [Lewinellaceae bacterium]
MKQYANLNLFDNIHPKYVFGSTEQEIKTITLDSRKASPGTLFAALRGSATDGHAYIGKAIENGAAAILCEELPGEIKEGVTYIQVADSAEAFGQIASNFYGRPSEKLKLVGVTGTNGKTTTATLLYDLFTTLGYKVGLISTIENKVNKRSEPSTHTTPDAESINLLIKQMVEAGCDYAFMEVSSHAVAQRRIAGLFFSGGVFTNITHEHLDYHKTFRAYIQAKKMFFDKLPKTAFALVNADDKNGMVMLQNTQAAAHTFALRKAADFKAKILENSLTGLHLDLDGEDFHARLIGEFNAYNLLGVYATARLLGQEKQEVLQALSILKAAEGRFDYVVNQQRNVIGIVDYAHTPDALEKVLSTIHQLRKGGGRILTVVGCGGDRDRTKRPLMAKVACDYSDQVIFTSDNPRTEDPEAIIAEMEAGIPAYAKQKTLSITQRKEAIKTACRLAQSGDVILVAGKGHEKYQEIMGVKHPFDDKAVLSDEF